MEDPEKYKHQKSGILMLSDGWINQCRYRLPEPGTDLHKDFHQFLRLRKRKINENNKISLNLILRVSRKHKSSDWKKKEISKIIENIYISKECHLDPINSQTKAKNQYG